MIARLERSGPVTTDRGPPPVTVPLRIFAAGSLRPAFERLAKASPEALELRYANARELAQRIAAGEPADVFASASEEHPRLLHRVGLVDRWRPIAANTARVAGAACPAATSARSRPIAPRSRRRCRRSVPPARCSCSTRRRGTRPQQLLGWYTRVATSLEEHHG